MDRKFYAPLAFSLILCGLVLVGCMSKAPSEATSLLQQDYLKMTNTQLVDYEQRLSDELVSSSRTSSGDVGIGLSFGSWGSSSGYETESPVSPDPGTRSGSGAPDFAGMLCLRPLFVLALVLGGYQVYHVSQ